jgi:hypothetical protein
MMAKADGAGLLRLGQGRGRVGVLQDHVHALGDQGGGRVGFLGRVEPGIGPDHLHLDIRVHLAGMDERAVDALDHLGDREGADEIWAKVGDA